MNELDLFTEALNRTDPADRAAYLDHACAGNPELRKRLEELLAGHALSRSPLDRSPLAPGDYSETVDLAAARVTGEHQPDEGIEPLAHVDPGAATDVESGASAPPNEATEDYRPRPLTAEATIDVRPRTEPAGPDATTDEPHAARALPRGTAVRYFGDYELQKELGRGGMGVVYKAKQVSLNRPVALKMIKAGMLADDDELRRFQNEAEAVALLDHPGIVPVYEVGEHDGQRYFSMKLVEGGNLADRLASFGDHPGAAVALMIEAAEAVQHAHMRGILHRDLKPANILVDHQGHPHITDFGLAKMMESDVELTASGAIMGTPAYMSPEQAAGSRGSMTLATDVYGLGAIFYAMLTGRAPFGGESVIETLDAVRTRPPEAPRKRKATIPRDLELICLKCLEKNPNDRYPTALALADDLRRWAAGEPVSVRAAGVAERVAKWARRKPTLAAAYTLGLLALLLGGFGGAAVWQWRAAARARDVAAKARDNEATARTAAETARDGEATARAAAEKARDGEAAAREELARVEYGLSMEAALQEWRASRLTAARSLLDKARTDLRGWEWRYVHRLCHADLLTLKGHDDTVNSAAFSPDGSRVVTGSVDKTARVWDARTGAEILTLTGSEDRIFSASFSPDGSRIVAGSMGKSAKVWDAKTGAEILTIRGGDINFRSVSFTSDGSRIITAGGSGAKVWDAKSGAELLAFRGFALMSATFSPDGSRVATADGDGTAKVWDAKTGAEILTLKGHTERVIIQSVAFSADGSRLVTASHDGTAKVWDAKTGAELATLKGHKHWVLSAAFSPDGSRVVSGCFDSTVKVWDAKTGAELATFHGHALAVMSASFSADGSRIVTASWDRTAKVWDATSNFEVLARKGDEMPVNVTSFSPDGSRIVTASREGAAKVRDSRTGAELVTLKEHTGPLMSAAFSHDGSRVVAVRWDRPAKIWDARTGDVILTLKGQGLISGSFSPDGTRVVSCSTGNTAKVWDAKTGAEIATLKGHAGRLYSASFSPDGSRVVTSGDDKTARLWDAKTGAEIVALKGHASHVTSASFSADGSRVVTGCLDKTAKIWDATTGAEVRSLEGRTPYDIKTSAFSEGSASFSPDGTRVVTATGDGSARVWDAKTGAELFTLRAWESGFATSVSFTPDGSRIATRGDNTVWIWDASPINQQGILANRLPAILKGDEKPADNADRLTFAQMAYDGKHFTAAARLWGEALASDPKLDVDGSNLYRWKSARAAVLAVAGQDRDEPTLDDTAKAKLRGRALDWLNAELAIRTRRLESCGYQDRRAITQTLGDWAKDPSLASIRDAAALAGLSAKERAGFTQFWTDVAEAPGRSIAPFIQRVATLPAAEQVEEVRKELKNRNPEYDGTLTPTIQNNTVTGLEFRTDHVTDIDPLRALTGLRSLRMQGESLANLAPLKGMSLSFLDLMFNKQVSDLTPLQGMPLEHLSLWAWSGSDLTPLKGMPLRSLNCGGGGQKIDLSPLAGMPLDFLCINVTQVSDLTPLKNLPITQLLCSNTPVSDLAPLRGMHLVWLDLHHTRVTDLTPIRGMPLNELTLEGTPVTDLSPLRDLPLKVLRYDFRGLRDARILGEIKTMETINGVPARTFWETEPRKERFPALLRGEDKPADNAERLAFAQIAYDQKHFDLATRLWAEALERDPKIGDERQAQHRYNAARAAVQAAAGQGADSGKLDDAAKGKLRGQALDWLKAELAWLGTQLEKNRSGERAAVQAVLLAWQKDGFLADVRDAAGLAKLAPDEQKAWNPLWADVTALLTKVEGDANSRAFRLPGVGHPNGMMTQDRAGKWLAVPTADKVAVFDAATGQLVRTLTGHTDRVYSAAFSPDGKSLAGGNCWGTGNVSTVKVWDLATGAVTASFESGVGGLQGVNFSRDGKRLFGAGLGGVQMWDLTNRRLIRTFKSGQAQASTRGGSGVFNMGLSPDGKRMLCQDSPTTAKVWDVEGDNPPVTLGGLQRDPTYIAYSPDGKLLATGSDAELILWDASTLKRVKRIATPAGWLAFDPDGKSLLTAQSDPARSLATDVVTRWDLASDEGKPLPPLTGRSGWPAYSLSPDGKRLYTQVIDGPDAEGRIRVYDTATGAGIEFPSLPVPAEAEAASGPASR